MHRQLSISVLMMVALALAGCKADEPPEEFVERVEAADDHFQIMLRNKTFSLDGISWQVGEADSLKVTEVHETIQNPTDGRYTADISFTCTRDQIGVNGRAKVTYSVKKARIVDGGEISLFPVHDLETLSLERNTPAG